MVLLLLILSLSSDFRQATIPASSDSLGKERQLNSWCIGREPKRIIKIGSATIPASSTIEQNGTDYGNSGKTIFLVGRSDVVFYLNDVTAEQSLRMYARRPGTDPDRPEWMLSWHYDATARNNRGIARLLSCDLRRAPTPIRRTLTSTKAFACYWRASIFAGSVASVYLPAARHDVEIVPTASMDFPTTLIEQAFIKAKSRTSSRKTRSGKPRS